MGAGGAFNRRLPGQYLYGDASSRGRCGLDCADAQVGASPLAACADLVAAVVYAATLRAPLMDMIAKSDQMGWIVEAGSLRAGARVISGVLPSTTA